MVYLYDNVAGNVNSYYWNNMIAEPRNELLPRSNADSAWKDILDAHFEEFMCFFYPQFAKKIDWSKGYESLDNELRSITPEATIGDKRVDKLMRVYSCDTNTEQLVLLHLEIEGQARENFPQRLFEYYYRLYDKHKQPIITIAILTDNNSSWRPHTFEAQLWGETILSFHFKTTKLLDYHAKQDILENTDNLFGIVVLAHLAAQRTRKDVEQRLTYKFQLTRRLYERGLDRKRIFNLYMFIDWVLTLPEDLEIRYNEQIHQLEREKTMTYITSAERIGMKKGYEQAMAENKTYITSAERIGMKKGYEQSNG